jgi:hypothetical protein
MMFISMRDRSRRAGQSALEFALLMAALCAAFLTMFLYMRNAVRARLLITQDRLNEVRR